MSLQINCPFAIAINTLGNVDCPVKIPQILRFGFMRLQDDAGVAQSIAVNQASPGDPVTISATDINAALALVDDGKLQFSPTFENFVIPQGEAITEGGDDNTTQKGQVINQGSGNVLATGRFRNLPFDLKNELKALAAESEILDRLGIFMVDEFNQVWGYFEAGAPPAGELKPIPVNSLFIGEPGSEGFNTSTFTPFQFNFNPDWAKNNLLAAIVDPGDAWNPLTIPNP
jgi:hypothetical protein